MSNLKGRHIKKRNFSVRDEGGKYLGILEVSKDIINIKKTKEEKMLLDCK